MTTRTTPNVGNTKRKLKRAQLDDEIIELVVAGFNSENADCGPRVCTRTQSCCATGTCD